MNISVLCFTGSEGLQALKSTWLDLFSCCVNPSFYNDWRWHQAIQQHLSPDDIYYFAVYDGDLPLAIIPLATEKKSRRGMPVVHLDFPRHRTLDCADLLVREGRAHLDILFAVLEHIRKHRILKWDLLELTRFTVRSGAFAILGVSMTLSMGTCSAYMVSDETGTLLSKLSKKQIKNTQRQLKKAESDYGSVSFTRFHQPQQILQAYATFLAVEAAGWKGEQGTKSALRLQNRARDFYQQVLASFAETEQAVINVLEIGGCVAAAQLGLQATDKLSLLKIGYDESLREVGPGGIALLKCLEAQHPDLPEISLVTNPDWAQRWHFACETLSHTMYFNTTFYGQLLRLLRKCYQPIRGVRAD